MFWNKGPQSKKGRIYADAAAATPLSQAAQAELARLLPLYGNPGALHKEAVAAKKELEHARASVAASVGAHADEMVLTASGTEANNLAIFGALRPLLQRGERVHAITSVIEHSSILEPLRALQKEGLELTELSVDSEGFVSLKEFAEALTDKTAFVSIQLVNSEIGTIEPVKEIAKVLRKQGHKILLHTDASQAPLWLRVGVAQLGVDLMTLDAQKVCGPKGIGILYKKRGVELAPLIYGGGQEGGLRSGTENVPLAGAFAVALAEAQSGVEERAEKTAAVRDHMLQEIKKLIPEAQLNGPEGALRAANNVNISIPHLDGQMATIALDSMGIAVSTRSACTTGDDAPSYVIVALGIAPNIAKGAIRITLLPSATIYDASRIAQALAEVARRYQIIV